MKWLNKATASYLRQRKRIEPAIAGTNIDQTISHRWRGIDALLSGDTGGQSTPFRLSSDGIEGIEPSIAIKGADIDQTISHDW